MSHFPFQDAFGAVRRLVVHEPSSVGDPVKLDVESTTLTAKLDSLEQLMRSMAWAVLYIGERQSSMSIASDALNALEGKLAALEAAAAGAVNAAAASAQFEAEAQNDAARIQQLEARVDALVNQLAALGHPAA